VIAEVTAEGARDQTTHEDPIERLRKTYPWPAARPEVKTSVEAAGSFGEGTDQILASVLTNETRLVVELGAWLGMSTRFIADHAPNATVVSVDHWRGSPEQMPRADLSTLLPSLYEMFLSLCWRYRDQIIPLRMTTADGLKTISTYGLTPDVIFLDSDHSQDAVMSDLRLACVLFPGATFVGDDYDWQSVQTAVNEFAKGNGLSVERIGARGWKLVERSTASPKVNGSVPKGKGRSGQVVLVPHLNGIEPACEKGLQELESAGVRIYRRAGSSQIDLARSEMLSDVLHDGYEAMLFIDADMGFEGADALRLLDRPEPVVAGIYAKKGPRELTSIFADGVKEILFGPDAPSSYPLKYAATGFLRIRAEVLRLMIERLNMPRVNTRWGRGLWTFFHSIIIPTGDNEYHYLGEDWSFSHRLAQIGVTPLADTSFRLYHYGSYGYSWEDAGAERPRYRTYSLKL
jgi:hypothetical protein